MYGPEVRLQALALIDSGHSLRSISMSMGINRSTLYYRLRKHGLEHLLPLKEPAVDGSGAGGGSAPE